MERDGLSVVASSFLRCTPWLQLSQIAGHPFASSKSLIGESWRCTRILSDMVWNSKATLCDDEAEGAVKMGGTRAVVVKIALVTWKS